MARKLQTDSRTAGAPPGSLHPVVMRRLLTALIQESRWALLAEKERRRDLKQPDNLWPEEIPTSGTMSGWMRNDHEANEYIQKLRDEGA